MSPGRQSSAAANSAGFQHPHASPTLPRCTPHKITWRVLPVRRLRARSTAPYPPLTCTPTASDRPATRSFCPSQCKPTTRSACALENCKHRSSSHELSTKMLWRHTPMVASTVGDVWLRPAPAETPIAEGLLSALPTRRSPPARIRGESWQALRILLFQSRDALSLTRPRLLAGNRWKQGGRNANDTRIRRPWRQADAPLFCLALELAV